MEADRREEKALIYAIVKLELGWIGIARSCSGFCRVTLPQTSLPSVLALLGDVLQQLPPDNPAFGDLPERLGCYFEGKRVDFPDELDLRVASPFKRAVWQATRSIPFGETRSYKWVAERVGKPKASRAVGQALAANPLAILVPCHRVIGNDGRLCGFGGGLDMKRRLLKLEKAQCAKGAQCDDVG